MKDPGWSNAAAAANMFCTSLRRFRPLLLPKHEDELIVPAREGTLRVLRAARDAGVRRVVLTSSFAAIGYGHAPQNAPFDETSWTNPDGDGVMPYTKSKTLAERAAWDFLAREGAALELAVVNPVGVFGPVLGPDYATSILVVQKLMDGAMPGVPRLRFGCVDVRDVADLHLRAMTSPSAKGNASSPSPARFISIASSKSRSSSKSVWYAAAAAVPTRELPDWAVRLAALVDPAVKQAIPELGKHDKKNATSEKAQRVFQVGGRAR